MKKQAGNTLNSLSFEMDSNIFLSMPLVIYICILWSHLIASSSFLSAGFLTFKWFVLNLLPVKILVKSLEYEQLPLRPTNTARWCATFGISQGLYIRLRESWDSYQVHLIVYANFGFDDVVRCYTYSQITRLCIFAELRTLSFSEEGKLHQFYALMR